MRIGVLSLEAARDLLPAGGVPRVFVKLKRLTLKKPAVAPANHTPPRCSGRPWSTTPTPDAEQGGSAPTAFGYTTACADATQKHDPPNRKS